MLAFTRSRIRLRSKLGDRTDDRQEGTTERTSGVDVFPEAYELDLQVSELVEDLQEVTCQPG
jgi:hypothetical protein